MEKSKVVSLIGLMCVSVYLGIGKLACLLYLAILILNFIVKMRRKKQYKRIEQLMEVCDCSFEDIRKVLGTNGHLLSNVGYGKSNITLDDLDKVEQYLKKLHFEKYNKEFL